MFDIQIMGVNAATSDSVLQEQKDGLTTAPNNLGLGSGLSSSNASNQLFVAGDLSGYTDSNGTAKNWATLMDSGGSTFTDKMRAIRMTFAKNQAASIWSNVDQGNYIDITKKQTLSMWLYFGPSQHIDSSDGFGDGMAFVMQNSDEGIKAFSHKGTSIGVGETLGAWGVDNDKNIDNTDSIASTAIPDSWALEFDTYENNSTASGSSSSFDIGYPNQHIAYGYPAEPTTYTRMGSGGIFFKNYYYTQKHLGYKAVTLHDGKWHHLTISWNPNTFEATYSFNDKNPDPEESKGANPITVTTEPLLKKEFADLSSGKLRWGFTATTGANYEANLVAFESIPSSVEADTTSTIRDNTQNKDVNKGDYVNSNDNLTVNYNLKYDSGKDVWKNIVADLKLPSNLTYTPDANGDIGTVTYNDGTKELIKADTSFTPETEENDASIHYELERNLDSSTRGSISSAVISINGVTKSVGSDTNVASVRSKIDSDNLLTNIDTPAFNIKKSKPINLNLDNSTMSVGTDEDANITGTVSYTDGSTVTNSDVSVYAKLKGNGTNSDTDLSTTTLSDSDSSGKLNFKVPADKLNEQSNTLEVYVMDKYGNLSNTSKVIIAKDGSLSLTVNNDYKFKNMNQISASRLISRSGDWDITVNDSREVSAANTWKLSVSTGGLYNGGTPFNGDIVYLSSGGIESTMNDNDVDIANGVKTQVGEQDTDISKSWNSTSGIFLRSKGLSPAGKYSGVINWTLSDTP
ncbi:lectin-like domain-containing protein [Companilactobacillus muriivasis]|uniref:lectin-like domain-containing protein n=1 Tax=Companilactobacillus muriivasis TaxID=3081444 RepID=UPI0030C6A03C